MQTGAHHHDDHGWHDGQGEEDAAFELDTNLDHDHANVAANCGNCAHDQHTSGTSIQGVFAQTKATYQRGDRVLAHTTLET